jgi:type IV secretory pathway VirB2 component (pilin)
MRQVMQKWLVYIIGGVVLFSPLMVAAQAMPSGADVTIPNPLGANATIADILNRIINFLLAVAGPIAVLVVVIAGIMYMTAGGSQERLGQAKRALWWAVIGIAILLFSKGIVTVIQAILKG